MRRGTSIAATIRGLLAKGDGSAAVEFALIMPLFLLMIMGMIQIAWILFTTQHLENATATMGRLIRTGQAQEQNLDRVAFRSALCNQVAPVLTCEPENLLIDVQRLPTFATSTLEWPIDKDGSFKGNGSYQLGAGGDIIVLRVFFKLPIWLPMVGSTFANIGSEKRLLVSSAAFQNEPF
jgi:Flp pilus assembly protein TadG